MNHSSGGLVTKLCLTLATLWTVTFQAPLSIGFHRKEYWSRLPFLLQTEHQRLETLQKDRL